MRTPRVRPMLRSFRPESHSSQTPKQRQRLSATRRTLSALLSRPPLETIVEICHRALTLVAAQVQLPASEQIKAAEQDSPQRAMKKNYRRSSWT